MNDAVLIAIIGLGGGLITALIALLQNRLNRKDNKEDQAREDIIATVRRIDAKVDQLTADMANERNMAVLSIGDKLRHYGNKYLADPNIKSINAVKDWLKLEEAYESCGGNHHVKSMRPLMEELLINLELEKERQENGM